MRHIHNVLTAIASSFGRGCGEILSRLVRAGRMIGVMLTLGLTLAGCGDGAETSVSIPLDAPSSAASIAAIRASQQIAEVSPPIVLQQLRSRFERYRPQVSIVSPAPNSVIESDTVTVALNVSGLPLFRDDRFGLGPHLHLLLDDQPDQLIFDTNEPIVLTDLMPGTHTLRVFAARPWSESFKNEGAFAQTTFHVYTKTGKNAPNPSRPLLTYNQPRGTYGAEPILLDFYLTNAPLHAIAQEFDDDVIRDWRVRVTVNGQSFTLDRWEPIYLKGVKPGQNWLQLELIDELGEPIENGFNSTVRLFEYDPALKDGLAEIVSGEVSFEEALSVAGVEPVAEEQSQEEPIENNAIEEAIEPSPAAEQSEIDTSVANPEISEEPAASPDTSEPSIEPNETEAPEVETEPARHSADSASSEQEAEEALIPAVDQANQADQVDRTQGAIDSQEAATGEETEPGTEPELETSETSPIDSAEPEVSESIAPPAIDPEIGSDEMQNNPQGAMTSEAVTDSATGDPSIQTKEEEASPEIDPHQSDEPSETQLNPDEAAANPMPIMGDLDGNDGMTIPEIAPEAEDNDIQLELPDTSDR